MNNELLNEHFAIFKRNFPYIIRPENEVKRIFLHENSKLFDAFKDDKLVGTSLVYKNTILMLCVDEEYRNQGIGSKLLKDSEDYLAKQGYKSITLGVSDCYIMPGVPMKSRPYKEILGEENIAHGVSDNAYYFFKNRGYTHSYVDANCFDMMGEFTDSGNEAIDTSIDGISYRLALMSDLKGIVECTDDGEKSFTKYYKKEKLYLQGSKTRVLIALDRDTVVGNIMINTKDDIKGMGSVGCTCVRENYRGRKIGTNLTVLSTNYLKKAGIKRGFIGYTYSGLDKMYGAAGYKIYLYYFMGEKQIA